ncbi:unnamed protein product, partial [Larinioides sclopetarius]
MATFVILPNCTELDAFLIALGILGFFVFMTFNFRNSILMAFGWIRKRLSNLRCRLTGVYVQPDFADFKRNQHLLHEMMPDPYCPG